MMKEIKKLKVNIFGESYSISTDENEEDVQQAVEMVNTLIKDITAKTNFRDNFKVVVLVALQLASRLNKKSKQCDLWFSDAKRLNNLLDNEV